MKKRRIITSVINNFDSDQRVQKVCGSLLKLGFDVEVIATNLRGEPKLECPYPVRKLNLNSRSGMKIYRGLVRMLLFKLYPVGNRGGVLLANDLDALLRNY